MNIVNLFWMECYLINDWLFSHTYLQMFKPRPDISLSVMLLQLSFSKIDFSLDTGIPSPLSLTSNVIYSWPSTAFAPTMNYCGLKWSSWIVSNLILTSMKPPCVCLVAFNIKLLVTLFIFKRWTSSFLGKNDSVLKLNLLFLFLF